MKITVWGYLKEYEQEKAEILEAIESVLSSGQLILGDKVKTFEERFAAYCGTQYGIGVNSATDALFLALKALGIGPGDEVITVANTAVPTASAIASTGATPRFVDIDPATYLMDTQQLESAITDRTRCVIPVHLFGQCVDMTALNSIAKQHGLHVIEDCAQAHGARHHDAVAGSMSDISCFSFYPTKLLGTFGDGGMAMTSNPALNEKLRRLRFYGMEKTYYAIEHGYNSRLDELHAAILLKKLAHLDSYIARRQQLARRYDEALADSSLSLPLIGHGNTHAYYIYVVRHPERDRIMTELKARDIHVNISYPWPIHTMTGYQHLGYQEGDLPHTEKAATEILSLPMYPSLEDYEQERVIEALKEIL
ncbi:MAG TPA: DegT/DnrJ/EryC1/StrS family aminotransferase [Pseudomonadales bacterium]|jgi:aminotransferase EvaB